MGWAHCGTDDEGREIGYGVDAVCDEEDCTAEIDRGLAYCCGGMHGGAEHGCGKYFCENHLFYGKGAPLCGKCYDAAPDCDEDDETEPEEDRDEVEEEWRKDVEPMNSTTT